MAQARKLNPMHEALREMGDDMLSVGIIDADAHAKITLRDVSDTTNVEDITPIQIKALREKLHLPRRFRPLYQRYIGSCLPNGAWRATANRSCVGSVERNQAQRSGRHSLSV